jgi:hypothetical protein
MKSRNPFNLKVGAASLVLLSLLVLICKQRQKSPMMTQAKAIEIGTNEAQKLGYSVNSMTVQVQRTGNVFTVLILPPPNQLGGDLRIKIDATNGKVLETLHGQ